MEASWEFGPRGDEEDEEDAGTDFVVLGPSPRIISLLALHDCITLTQQVYNASRLLRATWYDRHAVAKTEWDPSSRGVASMGGCFCTSANAKKNTISSAVK